MLTEIADGVLVTTSRRDSTTSIVVVSGSEVLLIDPAWDPDELDALAGWLETSGSTVAAGFATHAHYDHLLWHPGFGRAPRWASGRAAERAEAHRLELVNGLGADWPTDLAPLVGQVRPLEAATIPWPGQEAQIVVHDGHSTGHAAVWLAASRVLLAGDMLSDIELPLAEETGLHPYDEALSILLPYVRQAGVLVPGHGTVTTNPMDRWQADRRYLDDVLAGREVTDARLANAGMAAAHAANLAITHG